jgi:hypothetical protein
MFQRKIYGNKALKHTLIVIAQKIVFAKDFFYCFESSLGFWGSFNKRAVFSDFKSLIPK